MAQSRATQDTVQGTSQLGRTYRRIGWLVVAALAGVAVLAGLGVTSPGWFSPGAAFLLLGGATVVLALATVTILFSLRDTFQILDRYGQAIEAQQTDLAERERQGQAVDAERFERLTERVERLEQTAEPAREHQAPGQTVSAGGPDPFGDVHEIEDVEGIGENYGRALRSMDIAQTDELWRADAETVAGQLDVSPKVVRRWQAQVELMALRDIGPQFAELLARSGFTSIDELAESDPAAVEEAIAAKQEELDVSIQRGQIGRSTIENWIEQARTHEPEGMPTYR